MNVIVSDTGPLHYLILCEAQDLFLSSIEEGEEGLFVYIARSKTDQTGVGRKIGIPFGQNHLTCPVRAVLEWVKAAQISGAALFRKVNCHGRIEGKSSQRIP